MEYDLSKNVKCRFLLKNYSTHRTICTELKFPDGSQERDETESHCLYTVSSLCRWAKYLWGPPLPTTPLQEESRETCAEVYHNIAILRWNEVMKNWSASSILACVTDWRKTDIRYRVVLDKKSKFVSKSKIKSFKLRNKTTGRKENESNHHKVVI